MTDDQRVKAERLSDAYGLRNVGYWTGYIEAVPLANASADVIISNGVINLAPDKAGCSAKRGRQGRLLTFSVCCGP